MAKMTPLEELRHSASHIMATAVLRLFPETKLDIGPPTDSGFYYDFDLDHHFTQEDLEAIEAEMKKVVKENQKFERIEVTRVFAEQFFKERNQLYKISRLQDIPEDEVVTFYRNGEFTDLCGGTHVNYTKQVKAFKLLSIAGAYHRGDEKNKQLQRIYGTAFPSKEELDTYLTQLEEAKKRDHRKLGKELQLFHIDEQVGAGLILWTPRGALVRQALQEFISEELRKQNYLQVYTPHIGKLGLFKTSGHFPYYSDSQYPPLVEREELELLAQEGCTCSELSNRLKTGAIDGYLLKPMNCPMHIKIFDSQPRSYRDLPIRLAEFGTVYRWEQSGELNGMTRVRGFTQDDAHIFCTEDQVSQEIKSCLELVKIVLKTLGMHDYRVRLGLREPASDKYAGSAELWEKAENALREAAKTLEVPYSEETGEAAFYGPKIDFVVKDVIGREWQLGTVQVDYNLPERFDLYYTGSNNQPCRPVMIHRAPFGSLERFTGLLIEHFAGNFPTWLAPEQVRILPLNDDLKPYAEEILTALKAAKIRASVDGHSDKLGAKIRRSEIMKVPYMFVVGAKEQEEKQVSIRSRINKSNEGNFSIEDAVNLLITEIQERTLPLQS
ncbi:MAG: threonine--tRNA ligase [Verrucomicrobia bacterium CG_4_10_14_3_um_filter_43_23]|nr:MAG: threonine--tRNA ligase [Verrucomicrobia bacterium CG1_02_43_26]PIP59565.1 MAG: threonine--tRNA ligase [Verrucomicrobia bacterium CG22_combo_CG10-13_8_21_14_all_43_17]PIX58865.1 MAG: threonine--tRNA ligase [Verrucomicrobia bacterium CG_4_10_14_3_um_filter_43_23]PIY60960.1 MAG: threonine--tRNA ligase [Verrucomicrobia bacterium CG_4_10_14_0_8_um_filter_43_34]PJA44875.1 MAG: threonine--tRNA ligase [Verrucomicrobia bacterium CG_4_9_14_3_um_filter_43_20]